MTTETTLHNLYLSAWQGDGGNHCLKRAVRVWEEQAEGVISHPDEMAPTEAKNVEGLPANHEVFGRARALLIFGSPVFNLH